MGVHFVFSLRLRPVVPVWRTSAVAWQTRTIRASSNSSQRIPKTAELSILTDPAIFLAPVVVRFLDHRRSSKAVWSSHTGVAVRNEVWILTLGRS
ncbi:uncharacterized protein ARMOST_11144 [Armillaria ostoyae]|uniref:Uncharacterized protein n=1 Tax=Armillaria ostoyae TaxID=47428 RepID=A0A284RGB5_ARMOS|nr:uncharacterized protein ARMOST_11144 [Armillaria ostoyae]